jgi:hypothetical protein
MPWRQVGKWRYSSTILDLGGRWRWVVSFTPRVALPPWKVPGTHWIGVWLGPISGLDVTEKRNPWPCRESRPGLPARSLQDKSRLAILHDPKEQIFVRREAMFLLHVREHIVRTGVKIWSWQAWRNVYFMRIVATRASATRRPVDEAWHLRAEYGGRGQAKYEITML